jgi:hypothetical protein
MDVTHPASDVCLFFGPGAGRAVECRPVRRRLLNLLTLLSLLLCVAIVVLWVRSYRLTDQLHWVSPGGFRGAGSASGYVVVQLNPGDTSAYSRARRGWTYHHMQPYSAPSYAVAYGNLDPIRTFGTFELCGLGWYTVRDRNGMRTATGVLPFYLVAAATAALPLWWTVVRLRSRVHDRRRKCPSLCHSCGYDLTGNVSGVCPECGVNL